MANSTYNGPDRRTGIVHVVLTDEQLEHIAEKAAAKAVEKMTDHVYRQVGKGLINKLFWFAGAAATGAYLWLHAKGVVK